MNLNTLASTGRLCFAATLLLGTALATTANAETLTVTDVVVPSAGIYNLKIPTVEVTDGNLTEAEIRQLFQLDSVDDLGKWAGITAASLKIPEITLDYAAPGTTAPVNETITYRDIELRDVVDGVAGSTLIGGAEIVAAEGLNMTFGRMSSGRFDIGAMLGFYGIGGDMPASTEMREVYDDFSFEGGSFKVGPDDATILSCEFGAATAGKFLARPLKTSLAELEQVVLRVQEAQKDDPTAMPAPADVKQLVGYYTDMLTAFASEPMQFDGFDCKGTDPTNAKGFSLGSGAIRIADFEPGIYPDISLDGFNLDAGSEGFLKLGNFTWKRMDLNGPIAALDGAEQLDENWFAQNWRKLVPAMDGMSFTDVSFDVPDTSNPGQRTKGVAGLFDITLGKYVNGLPSEISLALEDATLPLPPELMAGPAAAEITARGITEITSDTRVKMRWDEPSQTIVVDEILSEADDFFRIALKGTLGNATAELFSENQAHAVVAGQRLTVKDLTIDLEDRGFYGMVLAISAAEGGQPLQSTRTALSGMVQGMTLAILGSDESALVAAAEMGKFLSGANSKLSITLTARDGVGLTLADLQALEKDPTTLAGKVTVTAAASGDPVPAVEVAPAAPAPTPDAAPASPAEAGASLQDQKRDLKAPAQQ